MVVKTIFILRKPTFPMWFHCPNCMHNRKINCFSLNYWSTLVPEQGMHKMPHNVACNLTTKCGHTLRQILKTNKTENFLDQWKGALVNLVSMGFVLFQFRCFWTRFYLSDEVITTYTSRLSMQFLPETDLQVVDSCLLPIVSVFIWSVKWVQSITSNFFCFC